MFVSCMSVNVCVKRNGNRKEGGREERAERDTCSDTETERRDEKERERKNLVSTRNTAPLPLTPSFLPACGGLNGVARCRGAHIRIPCPQPIASVGFIARLEQVRDRWSQAAGEMRAVFVGARVFSVWAKPASLGWVSGAAPGGSISSFTPSLFPVVTSKTPG